MLKPNDQVVVKRKIRGGTLIRIGSVVRMDADAGTALVHFPIDHSQAVLPMDSLEKTSDKFSGRARVHPSGLMRGVV